MTTPILTPNQFQETLRHGFVATITRIPFGLSSRDDLREAYDDRSMDVAITMGSLWFHVEDAQTGALVATAVFGADGQVVRCDTIDVMKNYLRRGVGTAIYKIASREFAAPVVPSALQSAEARAFWGTRSQITYP